MVSMVLWTIILPLICKCNQHEIGIKGAKSYSYVFNNVFFIPATPIFTIQMGLSYSFSYRNRYLLGIELLSDKRGFTRQDYVYNETPIIEDTNRYTQNVKYTYISTPIYIGYRSKQKWYYFVQAGYAFAKISKASLIKPIANTQTGFYEKDSLIDITNDIKKNDHQWFFSIGGGCQITSKLSVALYIRNNRSFTSHPLEKFYNHFNKIEQQWYYINHRGIVGNLQINYCIPHHKHKSTYNY